MARPARRCDACGKRRVGVTVVRGRDLCPSCADTLSAAVEDLTAAHVDALHVAAVKIDNAREDRDVAIRAAFADGVSVAQIAQAANLTRARVYQLVAKAAS